MKLFTGIRGQEGHYKYMCDKCKEKFRTKMNYDKHLKEGCDENGIRN